MKRFAAALIIAVLLPLSQVAAPAAAAPADTGDGGAVRVTLANGMHVILLPDNLAPVATTLMSYGVGFDDDTITGVAHATEHMLFRGTKTVSAGQLADIAARMGAEYNAQTSNENTLYYFQLPAAYVNVALHIEADRMNNAAIKASDWETERGAIQQEIRAQESNPGYKIGLKLRKTFFAGTPFADASGGTVESFAKMTSADIASFYHAWYKPGNATLIISGDINPQKTLAEIHRLFDAIPAGQTPVRKAISIAPLSAASSQETMDFPVGFTVLAFRAPGSNDPDYAASQVLAGVLNNSRAALGDLAASGKVLAAFSMVSAFPEVGASFLLAIPTQSGTPQGAQDLIRGILDQYRKTGVPSELIAASKRQLLSEQAYSRSSISGLGFAWAQANAQGRTPAAQYEALAKVTDSDVNRVLAHYYGTDHQLALDIVAKPTTVAAKVDPSAGVENVKYTPKVHEPLPAWAVAGLKVALQAPSAQAGAYTHLPNGISLIVRHETAAPTIILSGIIRQDGPLYEPAGKDGITLILESLLGYGTTTYDRKAYQTQLDEIAADANLGHAFSLKIQSKDLDRGVQLLADGLLHPAFSPASFAVVKSAVQQQVSVANKLPAEKADLAQRLALYPPGDPRRRDITETTIAHVSLEDVRKYYGFAYRPDETTIAIVGDVAPAQARTTVQKYFGGWTARGPRPTFKYPVIVQKKGRAKTVTVKSESNTQSQVTLREVFRMRRTNPDYVPLLLANTMLSGEGTGSLLFADLRTHLGYVYSVNSNVDVNHNGGEFSISFASDPKNVDKANAAAIAIIKRLQTTPLAEVELQRAKALLLAARVLPLDSYAGLASYMLSGANDGYVNTGNNSWFWDALVRTTPAQIQHAMRRINLDNFTRVIIAPGR